MIVKLFPAFSFEITLNITPGGINTSASSGIADNFFTSRPVLVLMMNIVLGPYCPKNLGDCSTSRLAVALMTVQDGTSMPTR
jgi:hypothetical protein